MENYQNFLHRINSFETMEMNLGTENFVGNPSLVKKVNTNNEFRHFYGDTVVFHLHETVKRKLAEWLDVFYTEASECFCERLGSDTFHMTLHDLSNSEQLSDISDEREQNKDRVLEKLEELLNFGTIKMRSSYIFNMVNTSLVLGLYPVDEAEYEKLMGLYSVFDGIKQLNYPLTPHITLAYYNVNGFSAEAARKLEKLVYKFNSCETEVGLEVELHRGQLCYQWFSSMNEYVDIR
ncbi:MAG: hypothetical protein J6A77_11175 [Lachnospiraceae bacterium]|nr:hypothetical protein [Lachnospiraceae bacterium]